MSNLQLIQNAENLRLLHEIQIMYAQMFLQGFMESLICRHIIGHYRYRYRSESQ